MARSTTKASKSESLTIRLDPKTRFILEYLSRLKGQTITTVVERAIVNAASAESVQDYEMGGHLNWHSFWDVSEGARAVNLARRNEFFPTFEEERRVSFCEEHWPFFFLNQSKKAFRYPFLNVLWSRIDEFIGIHEETKAGGEYWAAGKAMQKALRDARIEPPEWPVKKNNEKSESVSSRNLDDEIPF
ncbi:conserved protein of unknown function [Aminobacter niigataensis]|nr:conserved protein of unknown function [Aminobacter niigataensis]